MRRRKEKEIIHILHARPPERVQVTCTIREVEKEHLLAQNIIRGRKEKAQNIIRRRKEREVIHILHTHPPERAQAIRIIRELEKAQRINTTKLAVDIVEVRQGTKIRKKDIINSKSNT